MVMIYFWNFGTLVYCSEYTIYPTDGDIFWKLFQSLKLKSQISNVSFHWNLAKETFKIWTLIFE